MNSPRTMLVAALVLASGPAGARGQAFRPSPLLVVSPTVNTLTTGTVLDVGTSISADGRYVTLNTHFSQSRLDGLDTYGFDAGSFGSAAGQPFLIDVRGRAVGTGRIPFQPNQVGHVLLIKRDLALAVRTVAAFGPQKVSLREAVRLLGAARSTNIALGWKAFQEAGIDPDSPRTLSLPAGMLIDALLALAQQVAPQAPLVISFEDNVAFMTTQNQADHMIETRWYYTADLLANAPRWLPPQTDLGKIAAARRPAVVRPPAKVAPPVAPRKPPLPSLFAPGTYPDSMAALAAAHAAAVPGEPWSGAPPVAARYQVPPDPPATRPAPAAPPPSPSIDIATLISATVRPELWKCNGGKYGEIHEARDRVLITAPLTVHALLEGPHHYDANLVPRYMGFGGG